MNLKQNIIATLTGRCFVMGMSLASAIVLARYLGPELRGLFALILLLPQFAVAFGRLGMDQANAVYAGLEPEKRQALSWHSLVISVGSGSLLSILGVAYIMLGAPGLSGVDTAPRWYFILPLLFVPCRILIANWLAILRGMNRIILLNIVEVGTKIVSLGLVLLVVVLNAGMGAMVFVDTAIAAGAVLFLALVLENVGVLGRPRFDNVLLKRSAGFALPTYLAGLMTYLNYRVDQLIIAFILPLDQLAIYVIAVEIAERIWIIPGAIGTALLPHLTNSPKRDPATAAEVARHGILWTGVACVVLFLIAPFAIEFLFSSAFVEASSPLRWLLPGIFALTIGKVIIAELQAREKIGFTVWLSLLSVLVNAVLNIVLLPRMGIVGAAIASSISYFIVATVVIWYYVRETGVSWRRLLPRASDMRVYLTLVPNGRF